MGCVQPYSLRQGEARQPTITVFKPNGSIQNLSGAIIEFQVKPNPGDPDSELLIAKVSPLGITILDQTVGGDTEGQFDIILDPVDTKDIPGGVYTYDVVVVLPGFDRSYVIGPSPFIIVSVVNQA
jgi:hypothetical protein